MSQVATQDQPYEAEACCLHLVAVVVCCFHFVVNVGVVVVIVLVIHSSMS